MGASFESLQKKRNETGGQGQPGGTEQGEEGSMLPSVLGYTNIPKNPICDSDLCPSECCISIRDQSFRMRQWPEGRRRSMFLTAVQLYWMQQIQEEVTWQTAWLRKSHHHQENTVSEDFRNLGESFGFLWSMESDVWEHHAWSVKSRKASIVIEIPPSMWDISIVDSSGVCVKINLGISSNMGSPRFHNLFLLSVLWPSSFNFYCKCPSYFVIGSEYTPRSKP